MTQKNEGRPQRDGQGSRDPTRNRTLDQQESERNDSVGAGHLKYAFFDALVRDSEKLTALDIRIAWRIVQYFNMDEGFGWPGYKKLADELGCTKRSAKRAVANLKAEGWIYTTPGGAPEGWPETNTNRYFLIWERGVSKESPLENETESGGVTQTVEGGDSNGRNGVSKESPKYIREYIIESESQNHRHMKSDEIESKKQRHLRLLTVHDGTNGTGDSALQEEWRSWYVAHTKAYLQRWGHGVAEVCHLHLDELAQHGGVEGAVRCLQQAKERGFFGEPLVNHVLSRTDWHRDRTAAKAKTAAR